MMRKLSQILMSVVTLALIGMGVQAIGHRMDVSGSQRSDDVIAAKIARKQAKLDGTFQEPKNPNELSEYLRMTHPHPEGTDITQLRLDAKEKTQSMRTVEAEKDAGLWNWEWLGPGNIGGRIRAILLHPTNADIMWIGSASGGIWKTTNGGSSWFPLSDFMPSLSVTALEMHPNNPNVIYASTGEGFTWMPPGAGIFKTTNGGTTWQQLPSTIDSENNRWINDLVIHPTNGNILFAATKTKDNDGRLIRSDDGGVSWDLVLFQSTMFTDLAIDPDNPDVMLASTLNSVFRSDQGGLAGTWTEVSTGAFGQMHTNTGRATFAFGVGNDMVYASLGIGLTPEDYEGEIWRSSDNGLTWEWRSSPGHMRNQGSYNNVIWLEPGTTDKIIFGGINLLFSHDGGLSNIVMSAWQDYHTGSSAHADQHVIVPHINFNNGSSTIFFGNDGGIQKNTFGYAPHPNLGWVNLANNLGITQFYSVDATPDGSIMLGGTQDNDDLLYNQDLGPQSWYQSDSGDGTYTAINPNSPHNTMYAGYVHLALEKSITGGAYYFNITDGLWDAQNTANSLFIAPFALDKVWPTNLVAGGTSIWRTNNSGDYWHSVLDPLPGNPKCSTIEIGPVEGSVVTWVGYTDGSIRKTENIAVDWTEVPLPISGPTASLYVTDIEISPHDRNTIIVTFAGYYADRVWITRNNGQDWEPLPGSDDGQLPEINVNCVTYHPSNSDWIYVGTDIGIFASEDMGEHWSVTQRLNLSEGPAYVEIKDLIWHSETTLVAATYGRGIYQCRPLESVFVSSLHSGVEDGTVWLPFNTFAEGYNFIGNGSNLIIFSGVYDEGPRVLDKRIDVIGLEGAVIIK